jgi:hypothetical protein
MHGLSELNVRRVKEINVIKKTKYAELSTVLGFMEVIEESH